MEWCCDSSVGVDGPASDQNVKGDRMSWVSAQELIDMLQAVVDDYGDTSVVVMIDGDATSVEQNVEVTMIGDDIVIDLG